MSSAFEWEGRCVNIPVEEATRTKIARRLLLLPRSLVLLEHHFDGDGLDYFIQITRETYNTFYVSPNRHYTVLGDETEGSARKENDDINSEHEPAVSYKSSEDESWSDSFPINPTDAEFTEDEHNKLNAYF